MNRIVWMSDELIATTRPMAWQRVVEKCKELFTLIGNDKFSHDVVSPQECIGALARQLSDRRFSSIVDLTDGGWLSDSLRDIFPSTPVLKEFHISRVREVSSPKLPTSGHITNLSPKKVKEISWKFDLKNPLILDDVSFSGSSSELTIKTFGLEASQTTNAFLITNVGELGPQMGAKTRIESLNSEVLTGHELNTSDHEDGWHIKDFVQHPTLERSLGIVIAIHELIENDGEDSETLSRLFRTKAIRDILFPFALSSENLVKLHEEGRLLLSESKTLESLKEGVHTTNPTLLTSPYFLSHVSAEKFRENLNEVSNIFREIQILTGEKDAQTESVAGLRNEVCKELLSGNPERQG